MDEQSKSSSSSSSGSMDEQSKSSRGSTESSKRNSNIAKALEQSLPISQSSSWTILPPDRIELFEASSSSEESTAAGQRSKAEDEQNNAECKLVNEDADTQAEDVSDGISIISDCESTGRISPHPFLREHLNELSYKFDAGHELPLLGNLPELQAGQELRERRHQAEGLQLNETVPQTPTQAQAQPTPTAVAHPAGRVLPLLQNGMTAIFYVGGTLAVLAFIGRLRNPVWQVHNSEQPIADLDQRLLELELQNNLMRAEIDIMSKQLLYLSSLMSGQSGGQAHGHGAGQARKPKTFKAWPGNGDSVDPVDITKADLKRPYKCPDGKYVEIAAMCMEMKPHAESLVDEIGNAVNDVLQQSQAFHDFEKITERLGTLAGHEATPTPNVDEASDSSKTFHAHAPPLDNKQNTNNRYPNADASKERYKTKYHNGKRQEHKHDSNEHSKEHKYQPKEQHKYDSKERHNRKSKEQQHGRKQRHDDDDDDDSSSGEWHERMMHHREHARQLNQQKRNNNWYIERGGGREQIRSSETRR